MLQQPHEVRVLKSIHSDLLVSAHAALELALESTPKAAHERIESRQLSTLGHNINLNMHNELATRLGDSVQWYNDRGFISMVLRRTDVAIRLGRCDSIGRPHDHGDREEREEGEELAPFENFMKGEPVLYEGAELRPVFASYSLNKLTRGGHTEFEVDRLVLAKFHEREHKWSWALDPADPGRVRSVLDGREAQLEIVPTHVPLQSKYA
jgi:hypothetical protein